MTADKKYLGRIKSRPLRVAQVFTAMHIINALCSPLTTAATTSLTLHRLQIHHWQPQRLLPGLCHPHSYARISFAAQVCRREGGLGEHMLPSSRGLSAHGAEPDHSQEQEDRSLLHSILQFITHGCPWYMEPQQLALLREICSNLTRKKHKWVWLSPPAKQKSFRLKVPKVFCQDRALGDLWIQTHTHSAMSRVGGDANSSTGVLHTHKLHFFYQRKHNRSLVLQHQEVLLWIVVVTLVYKIPTWPTRQPPGCFSERPPFHPFHMQRRVLSMDPKSRKDKRVSAAVVNGLIGPTKYISRALSHKGS